MATDLRLSVAAVLVPLLSCEARSLQEGRQERRLSGSLPDPKEPQMTRVRQATPTVACIDEYCAHYRSVFHNVRHFEQFTQLILGLLAETRAQVVAPPGQDRPERSPGAAPLPG